MDLFYLNKIKEIFDNTDIFNFEKCNDELNLDNIFYVFQYPEHWKQYFGPQLWKLFEMIYLRNMIPNAMAISERWKKLISTDIKDKKIAEISCNIGVESYFIAKELEPSKLVSFEFNPAAIELTKLSMEMHDLTNVEVVQADMISNTTAIPSEYTDFNTTILSGHLFAFNYSQPGPNNDFVRNCLNDLFEFIVDRTNDVFYFLAIDGVHLDAINSFFDENSITIIDTTRVRPAKQYKYNEISFRVETWDFDREQDIYSGYVKL